MLVVAEQEQKIQKMIDQANEGLHLEVQAVKDKALRQIQADDSDDVVTDALIKIALEQIDEANPDWTYFASRMYAAELYRQAAKNRGYDAEEKYGSLSSLLTLLTEEGIYTPKLMQRYSAQEIHYFEKHIEPERDQLFHYLALYTLATRYLATDHEKRIFELPQERWMIIAMHLMQDEAVEQRSELVLEAYWALSHLYMTVATPTLNNAGKTHGQLSSCFIDTVDDSLQSIYDVNSDVAQLSKNGGGIGVYMGKVRGRGSSIKGFKGMSSGVVPWIRQLNNTAVSVDQLGTRKGAIAIYLDVWHSDIESFLDLKLNNGDARMRAHDIFPGVCLPD